MNKRFIRYTVTILLLSCIVSLFLFSLNLKKNESDVKKSEYYYITDGSSIFAAISIEDWIQSEYMISNQLLKESKFNEAILKLEVLIENGVSEEKEVIVLNNLGIAYACVGDYQKSETILNRALLKESKWSIVINNTLSVVYGNLGKTDKALKCFELLSENESIRNSELELATKNNKMLYLEQITESSREAIIDDEKKLLGRNGLISVVNYLNIAEFLITKKNDYYNANRYVQKADSINHKWLDNSIIELKICGIRAETCLQFGALKKSEKQIHTANFILNELGIENTTVAAELYIKSGLVQKNLKNYELALKEYQKALSILRADSSKTGIVCVNISNIYLLQNEMEEVIDWRVRAYNVFNGFNGDDSNEKWKKQVLNDLNELFEQEGYDRHGLSFEQWLEAKSYELLDGDYIPDEDYYYITDGYGIYAVIEINDWNQPVYTKTNILLKKAKYNEAIILLEDLLRLDNLSDEQKVIVVNNLGVAYACSGSYITAESLIKKSILSCNKWDNAINNNMGNISSYLEDDSQTLYYFQPLIENKVIKNSLLGAVIRSNQLQFLSSNTRDEKKVLMEKEKKYLGRYELISAINNLGIAMDIMKSYGDSSEIKEYLDRADLINNNVLDNPTLRIMTCHLRSIVYQQSENYTEWEKQINEALQILENSGLEKSAVAIDIYQQYIAIQKKQGNYTLAFQENQRILELCLSQPNRLEYIYSNIDSISKLQNNVDETIVWRLKAYKFLNSLEGAEDEKSLKKKAEKDLLAIYEQEDYANKYGLTFEEWMNEGMERLTEEGL